MIMIIMIIVITIIVITIMSNISLFVLLEAASFLHTSCITTLPEQTLRKAKEAICGSSFVVIIVGIIIVGVVILSL